MKLPKQKQVTYRFYSWQWFHITDIFATLLFLRIILSNTTEIAQEGAVPKKLLTSLHSQESLLGPYEVSQARINVSLILFLPVVPYY